MVLAIYSLKSSRRMFQTIILLADKLSEFSHLLGKNNNTDFRPFFFLKENRGRWALARTFLLDPKE